MKWQAQPLYLEFQKHATLVIGGKSVATASKDASNASTWISSALTQRIAQRDQESTHCIAVQLSQNIRAAVHQKPQL
jgi:hypothetical protein